MRYILINFVNTLRHYKASSMLNIFGMAVAFAAFFIIMTQVRWGFTYNQGIEDIDRIYVMTMASSQKEGNKTVYLCRPLAEQIIASATGVESYGLATFYTNIGSPILELDEGGVKRRISGVIQNFTMGAVSTFGFEAEQGSFDDFAKPDALAISSRFARENDLEVGDVLTYNSGGKAINNKKEAIWKDDFPLNSGPGQAEMIVNFGDQFIDSWGEWSWTYFVKLKSADDVKALDFTKADGGRISVVSYHGNFGIILRALTYILTLGRENLKMVGPLATLNANYIKEALKDEYLLPIEGLCKHEFVFDGLRDKSTGVTTMDVAKRLLDYGYHAPTIYFPLLFHESLMIEPTENESKDTIDGFIAVMKKIAEEAKTNPDIVKSAPHNTPIGRVDDVLAAKHPVVKFKDIEA